MANLSDLLVPYGNNRWGMLYRALLDGPKTGQELLDNKVVKALRRLRDLSAGINLLDGVRVRCNKNNSDDPAALWTLSIVNPAGPLIRNTHPASTPVAVVKDDAIKPLKTPSKRGGYVPPPEYAWVKDSAEEGNNIFLVGPSGSGKTEMARQVAKDLKAHYVRQNFNGETTVDNLIGYTRIGVEQGVSVTEWQDGELARAVRMAAKGEKVVYLADEVTSGKPEVLFQFHRILEFTKDGGREMEVNGDVIVVPPGNLTIMSASNTFRADETGMFQGTNPMNMAFANRWTGGVFFIDYAPNEDEIMESHGVEKRIATVLHGMAQQIRKKAQDEQYPVVCSTRQLVAMGKKCMKWGCRKGVEFVYLNTLTADERTRVVDPVVLGMTWPK